MTETESEYPIREKGGGDNRQEYRFGNPGGMLNLRERTRAVIFKAKANREVERRKLLEKLKSDKNNRSGT